MPIHAVRNGGGRAAYARLPDEVTGYALDPAHSWWSVVVSEATENLILNPSYENNAGGYSGAAWASTALVSGDEIGAARGARAMRLTNQAGVTATWSYTVASRPAGAYTWSLDVYVPTLGVNLILRTTVAAVTQEKTLSFARTGWQRVEVTRVSLSAGSWNLTLVSPDTNTVSVSFRTDGWQFENKGYATTYADGDMAGWFDTTPNQSYYWMGVPHASASVRKANTGTGGKIVYLSDMGEGVEFLTTAIVGAGMLPVELDTVRIGYERELHRGARFTPRDFTITGRIIACDYAILYATRKAIINLVSPNRTLRREPLILRYQVTDDRGLEASLPLQIVAAYQDGLRGNITGFYGETIGLQFRASNPYWIEELDSAIDLGDEPFEELVSNRIIYRDADGIYQNLGTGATDEQVLALAFDYDGTPLAGGTFTTLAGDSVDYIAKWDGTNWVDIDSDGGADAEVNVIVTIPEFQYILAGGNFTTIGGGLADRIAYFDGDDWFTITSVDTGFTTGEVRGIAYDRYSGQIFAVGGGQGGSVFEFRAAIGDASWTPLPNGGLGSSIAVLSTDDGYIWIGGSFTETNDTTIQAARVIRYNIDTDEFEPLDAGFNGTVHELLKGRDGYVYAIGGFTRDGNDDYDLRGLARWNGTSWEEVLEVANTVTGPSMAFDANGVLWYADFSAFVSISPYGEINMAGWANGVTYPQPFVQPGDAGGIRAITFGPNNEMLVSVTVSSVSPTYAPKQFVLENPGDADALPTFIMRNGQRILFVQNWGAGTGLYFRNNFRVQNNERLFIDMSRDRPHVYSDVRQSLLRHIYTGASNLASFTLRPGENRVMVLCVDVDATVENSLVWRNRHMSSDAVVSL